MDSNTPQLLHGTVVASTLDGVTTVLVAFIFVCLIFPSLVKHRPQFFAAVAGIIGILLLHTLALMGRGSDDFVVLVSVLIGLLQIVAFIMLVLCVGGLTARQLAQDMSKAYEVMRRGETVKEVIIPIGEQARPASHPAKHDDGIPLE